MTILQLEVFFKTQKKGPEIAVFFLILVKRVFPKDPRVPLKIRIRFGLQGVGGRAGNGGTKNWIKWINVKSHVFTSSIG
jgi:hypothetical protein